MLLKNPSGTRCGSSWALCAVPQSFLTCLYEKPLPWCLLCIHSQVLVNLEEGLGVSLVNKVPEELVFTTLSGIYVHFIRTSANEVLELSIQNIQVRSPQPWEQLVFQFKFRLYLYNIMVLHIITIYAGLILQLLLNIHYDQYSCTYFFCYQCI